MSSTKATRAAHARWQARRRRLIGYGRWKPFADAQPVRRHLKALMATGMPLRRISELTGVHISALGAVLYGSSGHAPSAKIRTESAEAVLAFWPKLDDYPPLAAIDVTGSLRRLRALATLGWPTRTVAKLAGVQAARFQRLTYTPTVSAATARLIRDVYDKLWNRPPTDREVPAVQAERTRKRAQALEWGSPLAWDEGTIDDPKAKPRHGRQSALSSVDEAAVIRALQGAQVALSASERTAAVERGLRQGLDYETVADLLGANVETVKRAWERRKAAARAKNEAWVKRVHHISAA